MILLSHIVYSQLHYSSACSISAHAVAAAGVAGWNMHLSKL